MRFDDDLNTRRLDAAFVADARADFHLSDTIAIYAEALNVFDADVETALTAPKPLGGVASLDQPRTLWIGLTYGF
jgi:outer membrane receptor for ferrienterochelin and colicin